MRFLAVRQQRPDDAFSSCTAFFVTATTVIRHYAEKPARCAADITG